MRIDQKIGHRIRDQIGSGCFGIHLRIPVFSEKFGHCQTEAALGYCPTICEQRCGESRVEHTTAKSCRNETELFQLYSESISRNKEFTNVIQTVRPLGGSDSIVERCTSLSKSGKGILFDMSMTSRYSSKKDGRPLTLEQNLMIAKNIKTAINPFH